MSLTVLSPGLFSLLVDPGRPTARHLGLPLGGPADRAAFALANALVRNPPGAVALELTLAGPTLRADHRTAAVVFGAAFGLTITGRGPVAAGTTFTLEPGDVLRIGGTPTGARGYLAVGGGFDTPVILGSRSALAPVRAGDRLTCPESHTPGRSLPFAAYPPGGEDGGLDLRAVDGPQRDWFPEDAFFDRPFAVSRTADRMGLRLTGEPTPRRPGELVSEPVAPGAVQVTNDGLPVVLGVDGQTIGGYPKVAHVIRADLDRLAQLRPGGGVRFVRVNLDEAEAAAADRARDLGRWLVRLGV